MYLDPGFGGMLIQILIALVAAGGALAFSFRKKLAALFRKKKAAPTQQAGAVSFTEDADDAVDTLSDEK